jgi:hypothetical protein
MDRQADGTTRYWNRTRAALAAHVNQCEESVYSSQMVPHALVRGLSYILVGPHALSSFGLSYDEMEEKV